MVATVFFSGSESTAIQDASRRTHVSMPMNVRVTGRTLLPKPYGDTVRYELRERWGGQPLWAKWVLAVYLIGFLEGACVHILDLASDGIHVYASFPQVPVQVFFVSLAVLDPLVAVLVGLVRREGVWLASAVMVMDVFANGWGNRHWLQDDPAKLVPLLPITLFGLFVVACSFPLQRTVTR